MIKIKKLLKFVFLIPIILLVGSGCELEKQKNAVSTNTFYTTENFTLNTENKTDKQKEKVHSNTSSTENKKSKKQQEQNSQKYYRVTRVVDGDTIEIIYNGEKQKVRLIGLNTTESKDPRKKVQCFSREASDEMSSLVSDKEIRLETGAMSDNRGYYGRLLRYVYLPNGTHVNAWMVKNGYGYAYTKYPFSKMEQFKTYQQQAREEKLGLWADDVCEQKQGSVESNTKSEETVCDENVYNCSDFGSYSQAKEVYNTCGGVNNDIHLLDRDEDKRPCESLGY